jgi:hypothetical protein
MSTITPVSNIPDILHQFKFNAPHAVRGQDRTTITLVKYPPTNLRDTEEDKEIISTWLRWWNDTEWRKNSPTTKIHWDSSSRTGQFWLYFGEAAYIYNGQPCVYCLNCSLTLQHPGVRLAGTKHLTNHMDTRNCKRTILPQHTRLSTHPIQKSRPQPVRYLVSVYSIISFEAELVRVVIGNNWSFRTIERPAFQRFIQFLKLEAVITSRYKFWLLFQQQYETARESLLHDLGRTTKISIALDAWSANNHLSFLAIKGYYISNNWKLQDRLLDFIPVRGRHTGTSMAVEVLQVLTNTNTKRRLLATTCDNAGNNGTLTTNPQSKLQEEHINWVAKENTVPCLAHIINLVVQDIIQHLKLTASHDLQTGEVLQQHHIEEIQAQMSVPNSLRKVRILLSPIFITFLYTSRSELSVSLLIYPRSVISDLLLRSSLYQPTSAYPFYVTLKHDGTQLSIFAHAQFSSRNILMNG